MRSGSRASMKRCARCLGPPFFLHFKCRPGARQIENYVDIKEEFWEMSFEAYMKNPVISVSLGMLIPIMPRHSFGKLFVLQSNEKDRTWPGSTNELQSGAQAMSRADQREHPRQASKFSLTRSVDEEDANRRRQGGQEGGEGARRFQMERRKGQCRDSFLAGGQMAKPRCRIHEWTSKMSLDGPGRARFSFRFSSRDLPILRVKLDRKSSSASDSSH